MPSTYHGVIAITCRTEETVESTDETIESTEDTEIATRDVGLVPLEVVTATVSSARSDVYISSNPSSNP